MWVSTHFSNFVFDMMSSFQLTKISPISPSVRQPESAIGFWKTCSQKSEWWAILQKQKQLSLWFSLAAILLFFACSVFAFSGKVKSNSLLAFVTAVAIFPKRVTSFWHRHHHLWSRDKHWDLQADCSAKEHCHDFGVNCYTNYTYTSHLSPHPEHAQSARMQNDSFFQGPSAQYLWGAEDLCNSVYLTPSTLHHRAVLYREIKSDAQDHQMLVRSCPA